MVIFHASGMQKITIQRGRPVGSTTYEANPARAFGMAVRAARTESGTAQEALAIRAGVERSHMGKIERGEHMPTLGLIIRVAKALNCTAAELMAHTEMNIINISEGNDRN
jgi:XRE family transcriptional regulator, regulator of sulfur utilization